MTFEAIPDLLADMIEEQKKTREAVIQLAEALAGVRATVEASKTIDKAKAEKPNIEATTPSPANEAEAETGNPGASAPSATAMASSTTSPSAPTVAVSDATVTYQDAAAAITKLSRTKGRDAAVALLAKFGAAKLPDVKPEQFADVIAAANEAMGS